MNIFKIEKFKWLDYMEHITENVNLCKIQFLQNNHIVFTLFNSYNRKFYGYLSCSQILKCCIENMAFEDEVFAYFVLDIYKKKLNPEEIETSLEYYHYGYGIDLSRLNNLYLLVIIGTEISFEIICAETEVLTNLDKYEELTREIDWE